MSSTNQLPPLPPGWTQHTAPSGHAYYYNASTKQSTYTRPSLPQRPPQPASYSPPPAAQNYNFHPYGYPQNTIQEDFPPPSVYDTIYATNTKQTNHKPKRHHPPDRPKSKQAIPNCAPWLLIHTKLRRRFVHNPENGESFWNAPKDVLEALVEFDIAEQKRIAEEETAKKDEDATKRDEADAMEVDGKDQDEKERDDSEYMEAESGVLVDMQRFNQPNPAAAADDDDSDAEEEVEVTDSEADSSADADPAAASAPQPSQPQTFEFTEDDIADQLAQMGEAYDLDPGEYGDPDDPYLEPGAEGLALTSSEATAEFHALLSDASIDPYTTFDHALPSLVNDPRYTLLPTTKARRAAFQSWSQSAIAALRAARAAAPPPDPRADFLALLEAHASPKLFWAEFRRRFKREAAMRDSALADREREKLYREHVGRLKLDVGRRREELRALLREVPVSKEWNRGVEGVPVGVKRDGRWIAVKGKEREQVVREFVRTLPGAEEVGAGRGVMPGLGL